MAFTENTPDKYRCRAVTNDAGGTEWVIELYMTQQMGWIEVERKPSQEQAQRMVDALNGKQES